MIEPAGIQSAALLIQPDFWAPPWRLESWLSMAPSLHIEELRVLRQIPKDLTPSAFAGGREGGALAVMAVLAEEESGRGALFDSFPEGRLVRQGNPVDLPLQGNGQSKKAGRELAERASSGSRLVILLAPKPDDDLRHVLQVIDSLADAAEEREIRLRQSYGLPPGAVKESPGVQIWVTTDRAGMEKLLAPAS